MIGEVRKATGMNFHEIRAGMRAANTDDPVLGAAYASASGLAVRIKGDRHAWNLSHARGMVPGIRQRVAGAKTGQSQESETP